MSPFQLRLKAVIVVPGPVRLAKLIVPAGVEVRVIVCGKVVVAPIVICPPVPTVSIFGAVAGAVIVTVKVSGFASTVPTFPAIVTITALVAAVGVPSIVMPVLAALTASTNPEIDVGVTESSAIVPVVVLVNGIALAQTSAVVPVIVLLAGATLRDGFVGSGTVTAKLVEHETLSTKALT
jgi:hypothetical protein